MSWSAWRTTTARRRCSRCSTGPKGSSRSGRPTRATYCSCPKLTRFRCRWTARPRSRIPRGCPSPGCSAPSWCWRGARPWVGGPASSSPRITRGCSITLTRQPSCSSPCGRTRPRTTSTAPMCCTRGPWTEGMPAKLDPFVDVLLRERGDQLYLLPDEPVTLVKDGKPRKVSKQPLTDQHIYALMVEVAPPEAANKIDQQSETEFDYAGANGLVRVRIVPEAGRLTAVISAIHRESQEQTVTAVTESAETTAKRPAAQPAPPAPKPAAPVKPP